MTKQLHPYRQGDVILIPRKDIPEGMPEAKKDNDATVLALGEVTGHRHAFYTPAVKLFRDDGAGSGGCLRVDGDYAGVINAAVKERRKGPYGEQILMPVPNVGDVWFAAADVKETPTGVTPNAPWSPLKHEEHDTQGILRGNYDLPPQREYSPQAIRNVAD
ncbi:MAG TPA: hypothetical protein VM659_28790 [Dongiaceae bacterium]|nr:hypothetical protein [Dongiaceae bacterium]